MKQENKTAREPVAEWQSRYMGDPRQPGHWERSTNPAWAKAVYEGCANHINEHGWETRPLYAALQSSQPVEAGEVFDTDFLCVDSFAEAMKQKLLAARLKGRSGWQDCDPEDLSRMLREHVEKGDPRDVANFCMFLWHLNQPIAAQPAKPIVAWYIDRLDQACTRKDVADEHAAKGAKITPLVTTPSAVVLDDQTNALEACRAIVKWCDENPPAGDALWCVQLARRAVAAQAGQVGETTYTSSQATNCAKCGEHKHTPLRVDWMGGYVCLTCIDKELEARDPAVVLDDERVSGLTDGLRSALEWAIQASCFEATIEASAARGELEAILARTGENESEALDIAERLEEISERITRFSNLTGDGIAARAAQLLREFAAKSLVYTAPPVHTANVAQDECRDAFDVMHRRAMNAEANVRELVSQARAASPQATVYSLFSSSDRRNFGHLSPQEFVNAVIEAVRAQATATQPCIAPGCYQWDGTDSCTCQKATATQPAQTDDRSAILEEAAKVCDAREDWYLEDDCRGQACAAAGCAKDIRALLTAAQPASGADHE
jgi:hypothetical protein